jgi:hypothetical protein
MNFAQISIFEKYLEVSNKHEEIWKRKIQN